MAEDFETWRHRIAASDEFDGAISRPGAEQFLRNVFDRLGAVSKDELRTQAREMQSVLAQRAVALVVRDLHATTAARPVIDVRDDDEYGLVIAYNGDWSFPAIVSTQDPQATREVADYLQGHIVEDGDVWGAWPTVRKKKIEIKT